VHGGEGPFEGREHAALMAASGLMMRPATIQPTAPPMAASTMRATAGAMMKRWRKSSALVISTALTGCSSLAGDTGAGVMVLTTR
jgi:hypothetical protein